MQPNRRAKERQPTDGDFHLKWMDKKGQAQQIDADGLDLSPLGIGIESTVELEPGTIVRVQSEDPQLIGTAVVKHCTPRGRVFGVGLAFTTETKWMPKLPSRKVLDHTRKPMLDETTDFYELLQISPGAEPQTIHRVYHMMAARFHPDNAETGSLEKFLALKRAYEVLSDSVRRAEYDASRESQQAGPMPVFELKDFVEGIEGEANRRLGVLSLLYNKRRMNQDHPGVSVLELEKRMNFPREHLSFTLWYLRSKGYISPEDNSDFTLTALGADYVEENWPSNPILQRLITGSGPGQPEPARRPLKLRQSVG